MKSVLPFEQSLARSADTRYFSLKIKTMHWISRDLTICTSNQMSHSANIWSFWWSLSWVQNPLFAPLSTLGMVNSDAESISCETMLANTVLNFLDMNSWVLVGKKILWWDQPFRRSPSSWRIFARSEGN